MKNELTKAGPEVVKKLKKGFVIISGTKGMIMGVKKTEEGFLKAINIKVTLSFNEAHFYKQKGNKWQITADGMKYLCQKAGVVEKIPKTIEIGGKTYSNPYFEFDMNGKKSKVFAKSLAVGRDAIGNIQIAEATILYDIMDTFINDLLSKVKDNKNAGMVVPNRQVNRILDKDEYMFWQDYPIDEYSSLIVNLEDDKIRTCLSTYQNNKDMSDRKVQTMAFRNAAKKHPAIAQQNVVPYTGNDGCMYADIDIVKWFDTVLEDEKEAVNEYLESDDIEEQFELFKDEESEIEESLDEDVEEKEQFEPVEVDDEIPIIDEDQEEVDPEIKESLEWMNNCPLSREEIDPIIKDELKTEKKLEELSISQLNTLKVLINKKFK